jgi:HlyD family secretion protein
MKTLIQVGCVILALVGVAAAVARPAIEYWKLRNRPTWRYAEVKRGDIAEVVNATGEVKPVVSVPVGAFVSGQIVEMNVEFNQEVKKGRFWR